MQANHTLDIRSPRLKYSITPKNFVILNLFAALCCVMVYQAIILLSNSRYFAHVKHHSSTA